MGRRPGNSIPSGCRECCGSKNVDANGLCCLECIHGLIGRSGCWFHLGGVLFSDISLFCRSISQQLAKLQRLLNPFPRTLKMVYRGQSVDQHRDLHFGPSLPSNTSSLVSLSVNLFFSLSRRPTTPHLIPTEDALATGAGPKMRARLPRHK